MNNVWLLEADFSVVTTSFEHHKSPTPSSCFPFIYKKEEGGGGREKASPFKISYLSDLCLRFKKYDLCIVLQINYIPLRKIAMHIKLQRWEFGWLWGHSTWCNLWTSCLKARYQWLGCCINGDGGWSQTSKWKTTKLGVICLTNSLGWSRLSIHMWM